MQIKYPNGGIAPISPNLRPDSSREIFQRAHTLDCNSVLSAFNTKINKGLSIDEVGVRQKIYGKNRFDADVSKSLLSMILSQFDDLMIRILLVAALISTCLSLTEENVHQQGIIAFVEPLVILCILVLNALVGVWQETSAEKALEALKKLQPQQARCLRNEIWNTIETEEIVPGDIVEVRVGDRIPADLRIITINSLSLRVEQSQLTGESVSAHKCVDPLPENLVDTELQQKANILFGSTTVVHGSAIGCVIATGHSSEIGKIRQAVREAHEEDSQTPLQIKLQEFGETLTKFILGICLVVWIINFKHFSDPTHGSIFRGCIYYFKIAVALAVAAVPEGLPAVITTCLALATKKMSKQNAIIRRLQSVETLGCTTVICSDKTGTLTTNKMNCSMLCVPYAENDIKTFHIKGNDFNPVGAIESANNTFSHIKDNDIALQWFAKCASFNNQASLKICDLEYVKEGEATEAAILALVEKMGCPDKGINAKNLQIFKRINPMAYNEFWKSQMNRIFTLDFTRDRKMMSVLCADKKNGGQTLFVKGAIESILKNCNTFMSKDGKILPLSQKFKNQLMNTSSDMCSNAFRILAFALKMDCQISNETINSFSKMEESELYSLETNLTFLSFVAIWDPPRPEVNEAIAQCRSAGIKFIMITGDDQLTAKAIAKSISMIEDRKDFTTTSITGKDFNNLPSKAKLEALQSDAVIVSRAEPNHKMVLIKALKKMNEVVAMTGDGVNDAPALKTADIGIAMGLGGTDVAKEASDMILADDNLKTIVSAVSEGRAIYDNMKAFIRYLISSNIGEVVSIFLTAALGVPEGLAPIQLLWVNLVTDGPPATALGFNKAESNIMQRPPRKTDEGLITKWVLIRYILIGSYVGIATVGILIWWYLFDMYASDNHTLISFDQLWNWSQCPLWDNFEVNSVYGMNPLDPCSYFTTGKIKASTLSLTVLVLIEMLNSLNSLSDSKSLLQMYPWSNPYLLIAVMASTLVHLLILYVPFLASIFGVVPLTFHDWIYVVIWSLPVILIDELLKLYIRRTHIYRFKIKKLHQIVKNE